MSRKRAHLIRKRMAGPDHAVLSVEGGGDAYRREPCPGCPWRIDQTGQFPAEAFVLSASTAYDAALNTFACHESGSVKPATCAGFLLRNAANNLGVRFRSMRGQDFRDVTDAGIPLHRDYRAMAVANGVPADHPALARCRANDA